MGHSVHLRGPYYAFTIDSFSLSLTIAAASAAPAPGPMAPVISVADRINSIGHLRNFILWSIPVLTLYLLVLRYSVSSSSESEESYRFNMSTFCTSEQANPFLVEGNFRRFDEAFSAGRCQQIMSMTSHPELGQSCRQGSLVCAACFMKMKAVLDNHDNLIGSVFVYPAKGGCGEGGGYRREMYSFRGGGIHWLHTNFPRSLRAVVAPKLSRIHRLLDRKGEEEVIKMDKGGEGEEKALCLRLHRVLTGVSNFSHYFALYHKDLWPLASQDVSLPRTLTDEVVNVLKEEHFASRESHPLLETSKKAPRRVLVHKSESLLMFFTPKAFIWHYRFSGDKIAEAYRGDDYSHPSVGIRVETLLNLRPRTRQLMQSPPPDPPLEPPSDQNPNPYHLDALAPISNLTYDHTLQPIINGPTEVVIQNVSVYLTGVLFNSFNIIIPPTNADTNATEYQVVLQVDSGSMLIELPPEVLPKVKHQVAVGNFWIEIPDEDLNINAYEWVPGAGIQFLCKADVCNAALKTLTYGKGLGTGRKSQTVFTILVYPEISGEAVAVAKVLKTCTMNIAGAGAWFTFFQYTKVFYTTSLGVMGLGLAFLIMLCSILGCCVCWQNKQERLFSKHQVIVTGEDSLYDETRVFNPFWIPSAAVKAGEEKFAITANPRFLQQLQSEHLTRMQSIGVDGTLDAMQFLAAAQAAAASPSPYANLTTSEGGESTGQEESTTASEMTATDGGSSFGSTSSGQTESGSIRSSRTSTPKSTRFSLQHESGTTSDTEESAAETPNVSDFE